MKQKIAFAVVLILSIFLVVIGALKYAGGLAVLMPEEAGRYARAQVVSVADDKADVTEADYAVVFTARLLGGTYADTVVKAKQTVSAYDPFEARIVSAGDKVLLSYASDGSPEDEWYFSEYLRSDYLILLGVLFFAVLLLFGRIKGLKTALSLLLTVGALFLVYIPAVLTGESVYLWTAVLGVYITAMTLLLVNGWSWLTLSSVLGCASGIGISALLLVISEAAVHLSGQLDEQSLYISFIGIDLKEILYGAIVIGAIGAIMDVSVNLSAALHELALKMSRPTFRSLLASGFTIGRDILGTMTNTLILAYVGSSMSSVLLVVYYNAHSPLSLFNKEMIVAELLQIIVGSFALLLTIPLTSVFASLLFSRQQFLSRARREPSEEADPFADQLDRLNLSDREDSQ